ncbi:MAG: hypothetical protein R3B70_09870 [Polyangiaceae bacterium]
MLLSDGARELLLAVLADRPALIEKATDTVYFGSPDLSGKRPRAVTRLLVDRIFTCSENALIRGDDSEFVTFIDHVTGMRAERDFHVSTLLMGFRAFRSAVEAPIRAHASDGWTALELLAAADEICARTSQRAADLLIDRQYASISARLARVERENCELQEQVKRHREIAISTRAAALAREPPPEGEGGARGAKR